ncbi:MAG: hydroxyacylglutathione hydrolase [Lysobacteraceae bacterium]|nr:MAG: hydroxyacylglutathione hydrolase [Xanthomonadaceae bacterium]
MVLLPLPAFDDNYIWCLHEASGNALFVDPGDAGPVLRAAEAGLRPRMVLVTHHHNDHIGGISALLDHWPDLLVFAPDDDRISLPCQRVHANETIRFGPLDFKTLAVPGHTRSHVAFHGEGLLFCGDTLFSLGCGRLFEGTAAQMLDSLDRIAALPDETRICCAHEYTLGNAAFAARVEPDNTALSARIAEVRALRETARPTLPARLDEERATNPFLRCDSPAIRESLAAQLSRPITDRVEAFAELRRWKDHFRA